MKPETIISFIVGVLVTVVCMGLWGQEYYSDSYKTEYYTPNDIIYIDKKGTDYHFYNENGGLNLMVDGLKERDRILQVLCDPASSTERYWERISTIQDIGIGTPREFRLLK